MSPRETFALPLLSMSGIIKLEECLTRNQFVRNCQKKIRISIFQRWARLFKNMVMVEERVATKANPMLKVRMPFIMRNIVKPT